MGVDVRWAGGGPRCEGVENARGMLVRCKANATITRQPARQQLDHKTLLRSQPSRDLQRAMGQHKLELRSQNTRVLESILQYGLFDGSEYKANVGRIRCLRETGEIARSN